MTDGFSQKYISLSWASFENRKNSGFTPGQNGDPDVKDDPLTRWPNDPVPCLVHTTSRHREKETEKRSTDDDIMPRTQQPGDKHWWWLKIISRKTGGAETWSFISSQYFKAGLTQSPGGGRGDGMRWRTILSVQTPNSDKTFAHCKRLCAT